MELRKIFLTFIFLIFINTVKAEMIEPAENLTAYDVIKIQLNALKNNDKNDNGIKQTWLFAHPKNKKVTGPYPKFRLMLYDVHYRILLNHFSHEINLIMSNENRQIFGVRIISSKKKQFLYEDVSMAPSLKANPHLRPFSFSSFLAVLTVVASLNLKIYVIHF